MSISHLITVIVCCLFANAQYRPWHGIIRPAQPTFVRQWSVFAGRRVVLNCSVELPEEVTPRQVQYKWERPEGNVIGYSKLYVIPNVSLSDGGMYICHSSAYLGLTGEEWSEKQRLHLEIKDDISVAGYGQEESPVIYLTPGTPGPLEIVDGDDLYSRCAVQSSEPYSYRWIRRLPDRSSQELSDTAVLFIPSVTQSQLEYPIYCEVTRQADGAVFEQMLNLRVGAEFKVEIRPITPEVLVNRPYEMLCDVAPPPDMPVRYRWYYNNQVVGEDARLVLPSLEFQDVGSYVCQATWGVPGSRRGVLSANATVELTLALTSGREIEMSPPPGSILVTLPNEMRELHCEFSTRQPQTVRWFFNGEPLEFHRTLNASGQVHRMDRLLVSIITLRSVEPGHAGTYECRVGNQVKQTHVIVRTGKGLEINPESDTVEEGSPVEFHCRAHGANDNVNSEMQWFYRPFYGGSMIPLNLNDPNGFIRQDDIYASHTSFISKAHALKSDEGEYICRLPSQNAEVIGKLYVRSAPSYRVTITPSIIKVRTNQPIELECFVSDESGRPAYISPRFRVHDPRIRFEVDQIGDNRARLRIPGGLESEFNGTRVECYIDEGGSSSVGVIVVEGACPQGYRRCRSGQCLPAGRFCDGIPDCTDRSDEDPQFCSACDPIAKPCEYVQNRAPIKKNYMIHWECDGEDDCGNGFDESNCPNPAVARCDGSMFTCQGGFRRIPLAYVCDKDQDCPYGEDERNCAAPTIQTSGEYRYPVRSGGQVILTCRVTGHPLPRVIWRFNWGCLPEEGGRFRITSTAQNWIGWRYKSNVQRLLRNDFGLNTKFTATNFSSISSNDAHQYAYIRKKESAVSEQTSAIAYRFLSTKRNHF
ncbi:unnamed protein product [Dicrocoelium dendriticum]|nr:unnamed protein product [Dicrocoelium dendriticum]